MKSHLHNLSLALPLIAGVLATASGTSEAEVAAEIDSGPLPVQTTSPTLQT